MSLTALPPVSVSTTPLRVIRGLAFVMKCATSAAGRTAKTSGHVSEPRSFPERYGRIQGPPRRCARCAARPLQRSAPPPLRGVVSMCVLKGQKAKFHVGHAARCASLVMRMG